MKIYTNKQIEEIYAELKELKKNSARNCGKDLKAHCADLNHIHNIAHKLGGIKGLQAVQLNEYPSTLKG